MLLAPAASRYRKCAFSPTYLEPSNIMCSKRWANPVSPGRSLAGPDVIPEVHGDQRQPVIFQENHIEAVLQSVFFELELGDVQVLWHDISVDLRQRRPGSQNSTLNASYKGAMT